MDNSCEYCKHNTNPEGADCRDCDFELAEPYASAPEMLEALEQTRQCLRDITAATINGDQWGWDYEKVIDDAQDIIAKAKGE